MIFTWSTIGHNSVKEYFERLIVSGVFRSHAFFFSGPAHIGKTTFVNDIVSLLLCDGAEAKPCGECPHCTHLKKETHPDVYRIRKVEGEKIIAVEHIREVIEQLQTTSLFRSKRICIIEEADTLSNGAANALLKTLEEPAGETFFFFIAAHEESIPKTIHSRCQIVQIYPLGKDAVYEYLISKKTQPLSARELSQYAGGRLGLVIPWVDDEAGWRKHKGELVDKWNLLFSPGYGKSKWYAKKELLPFNLVVLFAHDLLIQALGINEHRRFPWIEHIVKTNDKTSLTEFFEAAIGAVKLEAMNVSPKMIIDSIHTHVRNVI